MRIKINLLSSRFTCRASHRSPGGQVTIEYVLATGLFLVIFVWLHGIVQDSLKTMFKKTAIIILSSYR